jgi:hypothetical protein
MNALTIIDTVAPGALTTAEITCAYQLRRASVLTMEAAEP